MGSPGRRAWKQTEMEQTWELSWTDIGNSIARKTHFSFQESRNRVTTRRFPIQNGNPPSWRELSNKTKLTSSWVQPMETLQYNRQHKEKMNWNVQIGTTENRHQPTTTKKKGTYTGGVKCLIKIPPWSSKATSVRMPASLLYTQPDWDGDEDGEKKKRE